MAPDEHMPVDDPAGDPSITSGPTALAEYVPFAAVGLDDAERWPTLDAASERTLDVTRTHPAAPAWRHATGDRVTDADASALDAYAARVAGSGDPAPDRSAPGHAPVDGVPDWVDALVERAHRVVPRYRRTPVARRGGTARFDELTLVTRDDLRTDVASLVPVDVPLDRVLEGSSSGSTGAAIVFPVHPRFLAGDLLLLQHLVAATGARWRPDPARLGLVNLLDQRTAFTYASAMTAFRREADEVAPAMARVNLDLAGWSEPADRTRFLEDQDPQVVSSSPLALLALADLADAGLTLDPVAIVSGAAHLAPAARRRLEERWSAPVLDVYGLNETGTVASRTDDGPFVVVPGHVWVEVLDDAGAPAPDGEVGEVVVTTDENPYLPLLRYRTGDRARRAVRHEGGQRVVELHDLEGRSAVRYARPDGTWVPSIDATQLLQSHGAAAWQLHQAADGSIELAVVMDRGTSSSGTAPLAAALTALLDRTVRPRGVAPADLGQGRARRYSTALAGGDGLA